VLITEITKQNATQHDVKCKDELLFWLLMLVGGCVFVWNHTVWAHCQGRSRPGCPATHQRECCRVALLCFR